ncbi:hypothetical protein ColLi_12897 [Colletotrichum liriopes]|uniref:Uncharacterized protein n=1 Tax=Colletotrichum liriopes TaxID=708192 RepID=A0AA37GZ77_9PEZI|nr:hypothetical protein ColLi_12897 [Colletotrichum liriopes]
MTPTCSKISVMPFEKGRERRVECPDEGSLHDIIVNNPGLRLFVKPKCWTHFHLDYLGDTSLSYYRVPNKSAEALSNALTNMLKGRTEEHRTRWIRIAMSQLYPGRLSCSNNTGLHHYLGRRAYLNTCQAQVVWEAIPSRSRCISSCKSAPTWSAGTFGVSTGPKAGRAIANSQPVLAYVDTSTVDAARRNTYRVKRDNTPAQKPNKRCYKAFAPPNAHQDPFLAGIILALAQKPFYDEPIAPAAKPPKSTAVSHLVKAEFHDVVVHILTVDVEEPYSPLFIVYRGIVTEALLRKFYHPTRNPQSAGEVAGMLIEYTKVLIWPVLGLKERLGNAPGTDITGNLNKGSIETWFVDAGSNNGRNKRPNDGGVQSRSHKKHQGREIQGKNTKALFANESPVIYD